MRPWNVLAAVCLLSCGGSPPGAGASATVRERSVARAREREPSGELLAFGSSEGRIRNYFVRQGVAAAHLLTRSGDAPRLIVAFPANNQGVGLWFHAERPLELWAGDSSAMADALRGVVRDDAPRPMIGVRTVLKSDARALSAVLALLGGVRTLRDYGYGVCLEDPNLYPELRNETVELVRERNAVRIRREQIGDGHALELVLEGRGQTVLSVTERELAGRPGCSSSPRAQQVVEIASPSERGIELELLALSDEAPLTPLARSDLFVAPPPERVETDALAFLSYEEKLLAGSWRFLTYFGRDTLLSLRLLMPALRPEFVEMAVGSVLDRINLDPALADPAFGLVEVGDVAHEEDVGDFAAFRNLKDGRADLRAPRYDYKMIDDDFLLAPVLGDLFARRAGEVDRIEDFLARVRSDGRSYRDAILANLALVMQRARPFADAAPPRARHTRQLVALKPGLAVGQWRDSEAGVAFGRYPFDVNAALVPGALAAASAVYRRLGRTEESRAAERLLAAWRGVEALFRVDVPIAVVRANVADYARAAGVADRSSELEPERDGTYRYYGIALTGDGDPLPVLHSDHGFVMEFGLPGDEYLRRAAATLGRRFPAGLMSGVGLLAANPALAPPKLTAGSGAGTGVLLRDLFGRSQYHGTVVWSWQQALLASGLRRQLARTDIGAEARSALEACECALWRAIRKAASARAGELWSWQADSRGDQEYRAFGDVRADVDESNAIQLWSTVYLAVTEPARCAGR